MDLRETVAKAYELIDGSDFGGLRGLFAPDAMIYIPGPTRISGDHPVTEVERVFREYAAGLEHQDRFNITAVDDHAYSFLADTVTIDGASETVHYHVVHHWWTKGDKIGAVWVFPHEYDLFDRAWAPRPIDA